MDHSRFDHRQKDSDPVAPEPESPTLIPEHIVDPASQRIFLVSIFIVIQCWKIYDILLVKADAFAFTNASQVDGAVDFSFTSLNNFTFVIKYVLIDGLFLWSLPVLNVPLLSFGPLFTLLLTVLVNIFTLVLASNSAVPLLSSVVVPVWNTIFKHKELTIVGDSVTPQSVIDVNSHFKGKYTIQYLPASSVTLNPFQYDSLCLDTSTSSFNNPVWVPIELNTTSDVASLQIRHISPSNSATLLNYTSYDIAKLLKRDYSHLSKEAGFVSTDDRVFYLEVALNKPGKYSIVRATDSDGMNIRPYKSEFVVGTCPNALFAYPGIELAYTDVKCLLGNNEPDWLLPLLTTSGVLPLEIEMATRMNGNLVKKFNVTVLGESNSQQGLNWLESQKLTRNALEQQLLRDPSIFEVKQAGKFEFQILSVTDKLGIKKVYNPASSHKEINFPVNLKQSASLQLVDRSPNSPLLIDQTKALYFEAKNRVELPLKVTVQFQDLKVPSIKRNLTYIFNTAEEFHLGIKISQPGHYSIVAGKDKFCPCQFNKDASITITTPQAPTAIIEGKPISDKCVGTVGFEFDINFTGKAPFDILYEVFKNLSGILKPVLGERGLRQHSKRSSGDHLRFEYKPRQEGNYVLVFKTVKDQHYRQNPIKILEADNTFSTYFHRRSRYSFFKDSQQSQQVIDVCKGGAVVAPVYFEGNFPFLFKYEIVDLKTQKALVSKKVSNYYQDLFIIASPNFDKGGNYGVVIKEATDHLGCPVSTTKSESVVVNARTDIPSASFKSSDSFTIVEGDFVDIPIDVKSSVGLAQRDKVQISFTDKNEDTKVLSLTGSSNLRVTKEGTYRLKAFENRGCEGTVDDQKTVQISYFPKPKLTVIADPENVHGEASKDFIRLKPVCQGAPQSIQLSLEGKPPFVVAYLIDYPHGRTKSSSMVIDKNQITIPMTLKRKGVYKHRFTAVYDSRYTEDKLRQLPHETNFPAVSYEVQGSPNLQVEKTHLQLCENQLRGNSQFSSSIPVKFEGRSPFNLAGSIKKVNGDSIAKFRLHNVNKPEVNLADFELSKPLHELLSVGEHIVEFEEIVDANHCQQTQLKTQNTVRISVTQVPSIQKQSVKDYYCVGDHIAYNMSGISPFTLFYLFNDQMRKAEQGHEFLRLASAPGELAIIALQDSSASLCLVNFTTDATQYEKLKLEVKDLPSVEISHGDSIIKNIHEGDQTEIIFKFTGTPPFLVTYVRTLGEEEGAHKRGKSAASHAKHARRIVESKTIKDIWDYELTDVVGLEGTYEAIMVSDAFCRATRDVNEVL